MNKRFCLLGNFDLGNFEFGGTARVLLWHLGLAIFSQVTALSVKAAQAGSLFYQSTKTVMQLQDAHRNRAFWRRVLLFVVRLSRCEPFAGGMEIFNGFTWRYSRAILSLNLAWRAFFSRHDFGKARTAPVQS